ncbi:MAG: cytochrome C oxidase subunit I [Bacteroidetes bacterium]|nr:cytochrome C oxidase subunit I [Bacteroidota bacterium]
MIAGQSNISRLANTPAKAITPFFAYAAISFAIACLMLIFSAEALLRHYLNPEIIAITHVLTLGWVTMIIFGAVNQLLPVLIESGIYSIKLIFITFAFSSVAIPMLVYSFYNFNMGNLAMFSALLLLTSIFIFLVNIALSIYRSKTENIHAIFVFTSAIWLLVTGVTGFLQVYNFSEVLLSNNSFYYLPFHAFSGICGWFLLLVIGIGSRLIPMFLISKYSNHKLLWTIFILINSGMVIFVFFFLKSFKTFWYFLPLSLVFIAVIMFGYFCLQSFKQRIRKVVEPQLKISLISVASIAIPVILISCLIAITNNLHFELKLISLYGFIVFFVCLSLLILGMTFKTLPFIIWNKEYGKLAGKFQTPTPKEIYSNNIFNVMIVIYCFAIFAFTTGLIFSIIEIIQIAASLMFISSVLYNFNVFKLIFHKAKIS